MCSTANTNRAFFSQSKKAESIDVTVNKLTGGC